MGDNFNKKVMRWVYAIWFFKKTAPAVFIYMPLFLVIALRETAREFFVAKIVENFSAAVSSGFLATANYVYSAFISAPVIPVSIILFSASFFIYAAVRTARGIKQVDWIKVYR
jgi:hypothetical protein